MNRQTLAVVVLLIAFLALSPAVGGLLSRWDTAQISAQLRQVGKPELSIETKSYRQGWFSSTWTLAISLGHDGEAQSAQSLEIENIITHGPVPLGLIFRGQSPLQLVRAIVDTRPILPPELKTEAEEIFGAQGPIVMHTRVGLDGSTSIAVESPAVLDEEEGILWGGLSATAELPSSGKRLSGHFEAPGLTILEAGIAILEVEVVKGDIALSMSETGPPQGESSVSIERLALVRPESKETDFSLYNLDVSSTSQADGDDMMTSTFGTAFQSLHVADRAFDAGELQIAVRNLHWPTLQDFQERTAALEQQGLSTEELAVETAKLEGDLLQRLLPHSPEIAIERLRLQTSEGGVDITASVKFNGAAHGGLSPAVLMQGIEAEATLAAARALVVQTVDEIVRARASDGGRRLVSRVDAVEMRDAFLDRLTQQRLIELTADGLYRTHLRFDARGITANGIPVPLGEVVSQLSAAATPVRTMSSHHWE